MYVRAIYEQVSKAWSALGRLFWKYASLEMGLQCKTNAEIKSAEAPLQHPNLGKVESGVEPAQQ